MDPISVARYGLMAASASLDASAARTAQAGGDGGVDLAAEAVTQIQARQQFSANLGVIRVADEMWRALIDIQTR
jgi:flagellar hook-associated protein FlgK